MTDELTKEATKQGLQQVREWLNKLTGPLAVELGETFGIWARGYRIEQAVKTLRKTIRMLEESGINPGRIPPRLFLPLLESASIEDDEDMRQRWAALLANASAVTGSVHPSFIDILKRLSPEDARLLDRLYDYCVSKKTQVVRPWVEIISLAEHERRSVEGEHPEIPFENLVMLRLIETVYEVDDATTKVTLRMDTLKADIDAELDTYHKLTDFAMRFVKACRAPKTIEGEHNETADD